ncbi:MAG: hypothetical protein WBA46_12850 [Thermomicrobiales bacterium]
MPRLLALALVIVAALSPLSTIAQTADDGNLAQFTSADGSKLFIVSRAELGLTTAEANVREDYLVDQALAPVNDVGTLGKELKGKDVPAIKGASPIRAWDVTIKDKPGKIWMFAANGWYYFSIVYQYDEKEAIKWIEGAIVSGERTLPTDPPKGLQPAS